MLGGAFHLILQTMKQFKLNIINRENTGRGVARRLRAEGNIPACVYSKGNSRSISLSAVEFRDLKRSIGGGAALIELVDEKGEARSDQHSRGPARCS